MGKLKSNHNGFSVIEVVIVLVIVVLIGTVGWLVYKNHHKSTLAPAIIRSTTKSTTSTSTKPTTTTTPTNPYAGWSGCNDTTEGISLKYPSTWTATGQTAAGLCTSDGEALTIDSPVTSSVPYFFRINYFAPNADSGGYDGDVGAETIMSSQPLNTPNSKTPLYVVSFNAPGQSSTSDVFEFVLTDQNHTVGQQVAQVKAAHSQKINGDYYRLTANLVTSSDQQYLGEYTLAQYQAQPDYNNMIKIFQSLSY
jgi:hypothetical protein